MNIEFCEICPRKCRANRAKTAGFCGADGVMEVSKIMLHHWEEPPISGAPYESTADGRRERGSGAVFFTHCSLGCVYCQNGKISRTKDHGERYSPEKLAEALLDLEKNGAYNINFVSPTHYTPQLIETVRLARQSDLKLPIVWNTGGYELPETIRQLSRTVDIFLTDFKYASAELAQRYSHATDYPERAAEALCEMVKLTGTCIFDENGMMKRGVIVRHLVLPGHKDDSIAVLRKIAALVGTDSVKLSLMAQYTPEFLPEKQTPDEFASIRRKITTYEYNKVSEEAVRLGFDGFMQERSSATSRFTPDF